MAHTCPECGDVCYCRGDIDDCVLDGGPEEQRCSHAGCSDDDDFDLDDYDEAL